MVPRDWQWFSRDLVKGEYEQAWRSSRVSAPLPRRNRISVSIPFDMAQKQDLGRGAGGNSLR